MRIRHGIIVKVFHFVNIYHIADINIHTVFIFSREMILIVIKIICIVR